MAFRVAIPRRQRFAEKAGPIMKSKRVCASNFLNKLSFSVLSNLMLQDHHAEGKARGCAGCTVSRSALPKKPAERRRYPLAGRRCKPLFDHMPIYLAKGSSLDKIAGL